MIDSSASQEKQPSNVSSSGNFQEHAVLENAADRLLRPIEINQEVEGKYNFFESMLRVSNATVNGKKGNLNKWFVEHLNDYFRDEPKFQKITNDDISSLKLVAENPILKKFREIYGYNYRRPVFFLSAKEYQAICYKLRGNRNSSGMTFSAGSLNNDPTTKGLNIIVAGSGITDAIKHEIKHTLDSQLTQKKRHGKDLVLEEFAAFWGDVIIPRVITSVTSHESGGIITKKETETYEIKTTLGNVQSEIESNTYMEQYKTLFSNDNEYIRIVNEITGYLQRLQKKYDKFQIDRILMNATKIEDLKSCVEEQNL